MNEMDFMRIRRYVDERIRVAEAHMESDAPGTRTDWPQGYFHGKISALNELVALYLLTPAEQAEVSAARKEMFG